jgi:hypothetical protein
MTRQRAEELVAAFGKTFVNATGESLGSATSELLLGWLQGRIAGAHGDDVIWASDIFDGTPALFSLELEDGVRIVTVDMPEQLVTRYLPSPLGGTYVEGWRRAEGKIALTLTYEHRGLPGPLKWNLRRLRRFNRPLLRRSERR